MFPHKRFGAMATRISRNITNSSVATDEDAQEPESAETKTLSSLRGTLNLRRHGKKRPDEFLPSEF